jgi:hypothetical protein
MSSRLLPLCVPLLFVLSACEPATFGVDGFHSAQFPYSVRYSDPGARTLLSSDWIVENYYSDSHGAPTKPKEDDDYAKEREIELEGGHTTKLTFDVYDVLLAHKSSDAKIWVRSIPYSPRQAQRSLRLVAEDYAEALSGAGFYASDLGRVKVQSKQYASHVVGGRDAKLAGLPAYDATIEVANVDQLKLDPKSRSEMIRVVFVRTDFTYPVRRVDSTLPVMLMIGYSNAPSDFAAQSADFERFLALIGTGGKYGLEVEPASSAGAAPAPAGGP